MKNEKENIELKTELKLFKDKFETNLKETQALAAATETKIKELEHKISDAEEQTTSLHDYCYQKDEIDLKLKDHDDLIELLQNEKDSHLMRITELKDELVWKSKDLQELESHTLLTSASNSLSDELAQVGVFTCDQCNLNFRCESALKDHKTETHRPLAKQPTKRPSSKPGPRFASKTTTQPCTEPPCAEVVATTDHLDKAKDGLPPDGDTNSTPHTHVPLTVRLHAKAPVAQAYPELPNADIEHLDGARIL